MTAAAVGARKLQFFATTVGAIPISSQVAAEAIAIIDRQDDQGETRPFGARFRVCRGNVAPIDGRPRLCRLSGVFAAAGLANS